VLKLKTNTERNITNRNCQMISMQPAGT